MPEHQSLATAHLSWDRRWSSPDQHREWLTPDQRVVETVPLFAARGVRTVLDVGCGVGRHAVYLAHCGFTVSAIDASQQAITHTRTSARDARVEVDIREAQFTELPFGDDSFDAVLAWNVIYHGDGNIARMALSEIRRVLKPSALFLGTMISKRHHRYGTGTEIAPDTFVIEDDDEKSHPHFYCNAPELIDLLGGFELRWLEDCEQQEPGSWHWQFLVEAVSEP